jgi:hypothetical protein
MNNIINTNLPRTIIAKYLISNRLKKVIKFSNNIFSHKNMRGKGFSLIEVIIYITLTTVVITIFTSFTIDAVRIAATVYDSKAVHQNYRFIIGRISQELKTAEDITLITAHSIDYVDATNNAATISYDVVNKDVIYTSGAISDGLSSDDIDVSQLDFNSSGSAIIVDLGIKKATSSNPLASPYALNSSAEILPRRLIY